MHNTYSVNLKGKKREINNYKPLNSPILWFGSKTNMRSKIIPIILQYNYKTYVEVFGGSAAVLLGLPPAPVEIYNDIDSGLYNFFMVLADPEKFNQFYRRVALLPYSRQLYYECRENWYKYDDPIERAWRWFVVARQCFGGKFSNSWGNAITISVRKMAQTVSKWLFAIELLPEVHSRFQRVQIENKDWREIIKQYDTENTMFYLDPPYIISTRRSGKYEHELTDKDHEDLVNCLLNIKGKAVLSGYPNDIYKPLEENGWERLEFKTTCISAAKTRKTKLQGNGALKRNQQRIECIWFDPSKMEEKNFQKMLSIDNLAKNKRKSNN